MKGAITRQTRIIVAGSLCLLAIAASVSLHAQAPAAVLSREQLQALAEGRPARG